MIPYENLRLVNQRFFADYKARFDAVLEGGWYILGNEVKRFEEAYAAYHHAKHCVGVANGLEALQLSLEAFGFERGTSEVIVPSNTYIATILAIVQCGLRPVLVEPDISTYNIDPDRIVEAITPRTRAVMVVHLYGKCCAMDKIGALCEQYDLRLIEDCAQSHGARFKGRLSGTFGDFGAFSFYPTKNLGALGDAGAVLCEDDALAATLRRLRNYGSDVKYYNELPGFNSRLDEVQAAFLSVKLPYLEAINRHKRTLAGIYLEQLKDDFIKPQVDPDYFDVYHIFNVRHPRRDALKKYLLEHEIGADIHYPIPPHRQKAMQGIIADQSYPVSEEIHRTTLSLPCSYAHSEEDIYRVVEVMNKF
ncbi:DegT/DnrJ/EryC1/StrS family aminotransferase [Compostibacter hankyongensis]|uniref:DegT/DnrJ/EryC1/StrS family aminotransferase n=1 Tax=Compostibacter hankyongensis TaxID=1007089 RepID=A0ABP8G6P0_9BACT